MGVLLVLFRSIIEQSGEGTNVGVLLVREQSGEGTNVGVLLVVA